MPYDRDLADRLSRQNIAWLDTESDLVGARLQWDDAWLKRHCKGKRSGSCRMAGGRGAAAGECVANAPRVANRHHYRTLPKSAVYVGRGTPLGNRWTRKDRDPLGQYRRWLWDRLQSRDSRVLAAMRAITPETLLVCSCYPAPCHADVIRSAWCWMRASEMLE